VSTEVVMPALGMAQETGKLVRWLKEEGEQVSKGEPLMEIETDKAMVEVEAPATGMLMAITAAAGDDVTVGHAIAVILAPGESLPQRAPEASSPPRHEGRSASQSVAGSGRPASPHNRPPASPKARRLAAERGVDLSHVVGSGPDGAVLEEDVLQAAGSAPTTEGSESALWRAMAENVSRSWREAPHFFVMREIDASRLVEARSRHPKEVTYTDLLVKAVATALSRHPRMNGGSSDINIGLAVALPAGLIVPVIHGADRLSVSEIATRRSGLVERARAGKVRSADVSGGTFTVSNLGMYDIDLFTAILNEGQAGILAVGRIADRVVAHEGKPTVRPTMMTSLSCDHRRVDGARAAEFVHTLAELLERSPA
jgi:pyruvate dehydrogenase E2 component (dihydrolipoamide acetyltransferase)